MCKKLITLAVLFGSLTQCVDHDVTKREAFVGRWTITEVYHDWTLKPEWTGVQISFGQNGDGGGTYVMADTKYDSIWAPAGFWTKSDAPDILLLDDTLMVGIDVAHHQLVIVKSLPWTEQNTCEDGICLPIVTGNWSFTFEKDN